MTIVDSLKILLENNKTILEYNEPLHEKMDFDAWKSYMLERSKYLRACYMDNSECIAYIKEYCKNPLKEEDVDTLFEALDEFYFSPFPDAEVMLPLYQLFYEYALKTEDLHLEILALYRMHYITNEFQNRKVGIASNYSYFPKLEQLMKRSQEFNEMDFVLLQNAYLQCVAILPKHDLIITGRSLEESYTNYLKYERDFKARVPEEIKNSERFIGTESGFILSMLQEFIDPEFFPNAEIRNQFIPMVEKLYQEYPEDFRMRTNHYLIQVEREELTPIEALEKTYQEYMADPENDPNPEETNEIFAYNNAQAVLAFLSKCKGYERTKEIVENLNKKVYASLQIYHKNMPIPVVYQILYLWTEQTLEYVEDVDFKEKSILNNIIKTQLPTYLHVKMVSRIARVITEYAYKAKPELFDSLGMGYEELMDYVHKSAIFHDLGKMHISDLINTQGRALSEIEFVGIQNHPIEGWKILEKHKDLWKYKDPILYHHKWYNGMGGYPKDNGNVTSKYRIVIDIITLADCLDAATDMIGRSYKFSKTSAEVAKEFEVGAGTRYNPDLVDILLHSKDLLTLLERINGDERIHRMYEEYLEGLKQEEELHD